MQGHGLARLTAVLSIAGALAACGRSEPPTWDAAGASPSIAPLPPSIAASTPPAPSASATTAAKARATTSSAQAAADAGVDPGTLPQTRDRPGSDSAAFNARVKSLWDAIANDDPDRGLPFFFPVTAYEQVKDIPQPSSDWKHRLWKNYVRDIHALHARVSKGGESPKFVRIDVPDDRATWVDPGHEGNKIGYWRVFGTKIRYEAGGAERTIDVTSLISWRGDWYVVHLTGFK